VEEEEDGCHMINQFGNFIQILFLCYQWVGHGGFSWPYDWYLRCVVLIRMQLFYSDRQNQWWCQLTSLWGSLLPSSSSSPSFPLLPSPA
jgi:hypothetical protein